MGCKVPEPITTVALSSVLLEEEVKNGYDTWSPKEGKVFTTFTIEGEACSVEGRYEVAGKLQCEGEFVEAVDYSCLFNSGSKSELKFGTNEADFLAHFLFLLTGANAGKKWGQPNDIKG